jgi:DnaJ-class molecular chaperone
MEKIKPNKLICPACKGNGYRKIFKDATSKLRVVIDCEACDNQGEIKNDEKNIFAMRYLNNVL